MKLRATLRSSDTPAQRAANIATMLGWAHDSARAGQEAVLADLISTYAEIDGRAYDASVDSYRSWQAAIAAMRAALAGGEG